jgi:hypothetical protein
VPHLGTWVADPLTALRADMAAPLAALALGLGLLLTAGVRIMGEGWRPFVIGYLAIFLLSVLSFVASGQQSVKAIGLEYALWALAFGLIVANTVGTPRWLLAGAKSEMYIKTGLVLLGAEILFSEILRLGAPGLIVAWVVTPIVIVVMWFFGTRWLRMASKSFVIIVAAATSVCGVSAAIATAAACRAKKQELTLAVGMTMIFTVLMMVFMPAIAKLAGLEPAVALVVAAIHVGTNHAGGPFGRVWTNNVERGINASAFFYTELGPASELIDLRDGHYADPGPEPSGLEP